MEQKSTKIRQLPIHTENPFLTPANIHPEMKRRTEVVFDGKHAIMHRETGEVQDDQIAMAKIKWVESNQFVKVYAKQMHVLFDLGKPAQRVCEFVMHQVSTRALNKGEVVLSFLEYEEYMSGRPGKTRQTFMRGQQELASKNLIAKSRARDIWYINPAIIFNGDRARFITEIRKKQRSKAELLEDEGQIPLIERAADERSDSPEEESNNIADAK